MSGTLPSPGLAFAPVRAAVPTDLCFYISGETFFISKQLKKPQSHPKNPIVAHATPVAIRFGMALSQVHTQKLKLRRLPAKQLQAQGNGVSCESSNSTIGLSSLRMPSSLCSAHHRQRPLLSFRSRQVAFANGTEPFAPFAVIGCPCASFCVLCSHRNPRSAGTRSVLLEAKDLLAGKLELPPPRSRSSSPRLSAPMCSVRIPEVPPICGDTGRDTVCNVGRARLSGRGAEK